MKKKLLVASCLLLVWSANTLPSAGQLVDRDKLSVSISKLAEKYNIPDYSLAFVRNDSLLFTLSKHPENEGKNYLIGSCSKSFTALAVLRLAEEDKIDIDRPVRDYLPWFALKNNRLTDSVTVRRLLNHKSGFERQHGFYDPLTGDQATYEQKLENYILSLNIRYAPGTYFLYSNLNYVLLGLIVSNVTGSSYSQYLSEAILPAAGMPGTRLTFTENNRDNLIQPYHYIFCGMPFRSKTYRYSDFMVPAGYISSNASDLAAYLKFLLSGTVNSKGDTLLSGSRFHDLTGGERTGYAMGWFNTIYNSVRVIRHTGLDENFSSSLDFYPDKNVGWALLCNVNSLEFCDRVDRVIDAQLRGWPDPPVRSAETLMRWLAFFLPLVLAGSLVINLLRWRRHGFRTGIVTRILPGLRLISGIFLSVIGLIFISKAFQMNIIDGVRFGPDLMWGLILIAVFGIAGSFARYFGTYSKSHK